MNQLKALDTPYRGYRFRSRTEARWAVFMDNAHVKWEYEREAYDLGGIYYLPDFWLPELQYFIEIKPEYPDAEECRKATALAQHSGKNMFVIYGQPNPPDWNGSPYSESAVLFTNPHGWSDDAYWWCECPHCKKVDLQFNGRADRIDCACPRSAHGNKGYNHDSPKLIAAYKMALGFRFDRQKI